MPVVCPTVTAAEPHQYREQMKLAASLSNRAHVDMADGKLARKLIDPVQMWFPDDITIDLHMMVRQPLKYLDTILNLRPSLAIIHAEAEGDFAALADQLHEVGIKVGVALLQDTTIETIKPALYMIDHVLIFSGHLGHFGGHADLHLLTKVKALKDLKPNLEIGWDGGIDDGNADVLAKGGVDVLNVGGFIQRAHDPKAAYAKLNSIVK